jgi:flagellin
MPGISIANNLLASSVQYNLNKNQTALQKVASQLSSGLRINSPSDDPAGYTIATDLQTQISGYDQASQNIQSASSAATIATGALSNITSILQQINSLAVEGSSNLLSTNDRTNIQTQINQLVGEANSIASNTTFNGINLLNGSSAGFQAAQNATATITQNSALNSSTSNANLVSGVSVSTTNAAVTDGTLEFTVIQGATLQTQVYYITSAGSAGQLLTTVSNFGASANVTLAGVTVALSGIGTADVGLSSYVKIGQYVSSTNYTTQPALSVQTGPSAGQSVSLNIGSVTASSLRISNLNVQSGASGFNSLAAQDVIGQVQNAIQTVSQLQAQIGSVQTRLQTETDNDNLASVNLQAARSNIRDLDIAQASSEYAKDQLLVDFGTSLLAQSNSSANAVLSLFR